MAAPPKERTTDSGVPVAPYFDVPEFPAPLPPPGTYPYTRGIYPEMYRARRWTMRQYAGFASAEATNARFKALLAKGQTGLSVAFDLPTQLGYDADDPMAAGEVGKVGVSISRLEDMRILFDGIPLRDVTTSMTINAPAAILLLMYQIVGEEQGADVKHLGGTIQNDPLKEYQARGTYIYPPRPSMRLVTDTFAYCAKHLPQWNPISISGYHMREAGCSAAQEIAFTLANAIAYVEAGLKAGLSVDAFAPRLSFFFGAHNDLFEEVAKFRAARRIWAMLMKEQFGAQDKRSLLLRFHTQTCGCTLTAQQPYNNVVRVALQGLAAVLGGTQSLHTNSFDEALGLPTEHAATLALRTQQIIAEESGVTATADPLGGSYYVEALTDGVEHEAHRWMERVAERGGAVAATESGFIAGAIAEHAYRQEMGQESGTRVVVGVNRYVEQEEIDVPILRPDPDAERQQIARLAAHRAVRNVIACESALGVVRTAAQGEGELLGPMRAALLAGATLGEICTALREVWGTYRAARPV
ncbi:MAG: methylmalonyl-CoA mutase family protein [Thermomicrobia bacterium]|nr:methylmalonyl-CoA mutase family protein [Thermomicrobia bacterium]